MDDLVADTFLVCLRRLDRVPVEPLPWLYAVARKTIANERRRRTRTATTSRREVAWDAEPAGDNVLASAFAALNDRDREILRLVAWESLSLVEAALVLGCSTVACRVRFHRAKARLAARLESPASFRPEPEGVTR